MIGPTPTGTPFDIRPRAAGYFADGLDAVPLEPRGKGLKVAGWQTKAFTPDDFRPENNVGLRLGKDGLADVDLDCPEALAIAPGFLPETGFVFGRASARASHHFYKLIPAVASVERKDPITGDMLIELRCLTHDGAIGRQTVAPGSIHAGTGEPIDFETGVSRMIQNVDADEVVDAVNRIAAAALLARYWPAKGRHDTMLALAGVLAKGGWLEVEALAFCRAVYRLVPSGATPKAPERVKTEVSSTYEAMAEGVPFTGIPKLKEAIDKRVVDAVLKWLGVQITEPAALAAGDTTTKAYPSTADEWPEPMPLEGELPAVKPFDERALPELFRALVCDVADRAQVPLDFPAAVAVLALAGATGRRARIQPKAKDNSWIVVPNLWGGIVAPPGQLKSPIIGEITKPLRMIESGFRKSHEAAMEAHQEALQEHELHFAAWKEKFKAASKSGKAAPPRPERAPEVPSSQSLIVNDATMEALHKKMQSSPAGIFVIRDELTGWLSQLDKPGREGERAFALSAWNGDTSHTVDRIGRGEVHVDHCCMSLLGGIQPSRLRSYLSEALADGPSNDGLMQRFQVTVWPDTFTGKYVDRAPSLQYAEEEAEVFSRLVGMNPEYSPVYKFHPRAQNLFEEWYVKNDAKAKSEATHPAMAAHLAKYRSLMPSLALLFELAEGGGDGEVSLQHAMQAQWWCEYLESHANRIYSAVVSPHIRAAQELSRKIKARKVGASGVFAIREVYLKGWTGLDTPDLARLAADTLADAGWIRKAEFEIGATGGRPSNRYEVNPRVWNGAGDADEDGES